MEHNVNGFTGYGAAMYGNSRPIAEEQLEADRMEHAMTNTITATWNGDGDTYSLPMTGFSKATEGELRFWVADYADTYGIPFDPSTLTFTTGA